MYQALAERIGRLDILMITFDALRYDVAERAWLDGKTPCLRKLLPGGWEPRHSPGSFTYAAHTSFFAGFFPTPVAPGVHPRPFSLRFPSSRSESLGSVKLDGSSIVEGLRARGYHTICVGGVGFFSKQNPLGCVLPDLFDESHWRPTFGATEAASTRHQIDCAVDRLQGASRPKPVFLFLNLSALHPPTHHYVDGAKSDSTETQLAALVYVDRQLPRLLEAFHSRGREGIAFLMSDHGTTFGDDGYHGHRLAHPAVWTVPYGEWNWVAAR